MKRVIQGLLSLLIITMLVSCGSKQKGTEFDKYTDQELLELAGEQYRAGNMEAALETGNRLLMQYPTSNLHIETQLLMAKAHGALDQYEEQMNLLLRLLRENIIPEYSPQIYVQIGKFYERAALFNPGIVTTDTADYRTAMEYYDKAINYPDSDDDLARSEAQFRRGLVEAKIGEINKAIESYRAVINRYPDSDFSLLAQLKMQNPQNTTELPTDQASMAEYRQQLNAPEQAAGGDEAGTSGSAVSEEDEESMDTLIEQTLETPAEQDVPAEASPPESMDEESDAEQSESLMTPEPEPAIPDTSTFEALPDTATGF